MQAHWGVDDPAAAQEPDWEAAFRTAFDVLQTRADALLALPFETLERDALKAALQQIGRINETA